MKSSTSSIIGASSGALIGGISAISSRKKLRNELKLKHPHLNERELDKLASRELARRIAIRSGIGALGGAALGYGGHKVISNSKRAYDKYVGNIPKSTNPINISDFKKGDIIAYDRGGYSHYGVVIDNKGNTVEFKRHDEADPSKASVVRTNIIDSAGTSKVTKMPNRTGKYTPDEIAERALKYVGSNLGGYNLTNNNCEHFVRYVAEGKKSSTQIDDKAKNSPLLGLIIGHSKSRYRNSQFSDKGLGNQLSGAVHSIAIDQMYNARKNIKDRNLGGLSKLGKYQTAISSGVGGIIGGAVGNYIGRKKFKKAIALNNLKPGTLEYDMAKRHYVTHGTLKGAGIGALAGTGISYGTDAIRGKIVKDKIRNSHGISLDTSNRRIGRSFRGIKSEDQLNDYARKWKQLYEWQRDTLI